MDPAHLDWPLVSRSQLKALRRRGLGRCRDALDRWHTAVPPDGPIIEQYLLPDELQDRFVTNICFGGPDLRTAYLTLSPRSLPMA